MEPRIENDEIDLLEIFFLLKQKVVFLIAALILGAGLMGGYTLFFVTPQYEATSELYVLSKSTSVTSLADIQIGSQLTNDYIILIKSRPVLENVISNLGVDMSYAALEKSLTITNPTNSRILDITVKHSVPQTAQRLANEIALVTIERMAEVMATDPPSLVEEAVIPTHRVSPSYSRNCILGGIAALVAAMAFFVVRYLLDDTIKNEEDIEKYLKIGTLAIVPKVEDKNVKKTTGTHKSKSTAKVKRQQKSEQKKGA